MEAAQDFSNRTLTMTRTFNAPRDLVWDAWTKPEHISNWWGPKGMKTEIKKHEFKAGGDWEYTMAMPDGNEFRSFGQYQKIVEPELIETTANFIPMTVGVTLIASFSDAGEQTHFEFKVVHETEEYAKQQYEMGFDKGWGSVFEGLNTYLEGLKS
ncbi:MAG TPA: activator of HSP90 ATPase [Cytophagales bacterium]|nr:activator of HSP90 ATPase [Cytophagales bacterium]HAP62850.1 activator of HSP90 ATPase [Cytophagales bacterium]